jgi:hypothetical protein
MSFNVRDASHRRDEVTAVCRKSTLLEGSFGDQREKLTVDSY